MKNSINEINNELVSLGNRTDQMKVRISNIEDRNLEEIQV